MADKCKKDRCGEVEFCEAAKTAWAEGFIEHQTLKNRTTGKRRERMALMKGRFSMELPFCPFCRANVNTAPKEPPQCNE